MVWDGIWQAMRKLRCFVPVKLWITALTLHVLIRRCTSNREAHGSSSVAARRRGGVGAQGLLRYQGTGANSPPRQLSKYIHTNREEVEWRCGGDIQWAHSCSRLSRLLLGSRTRLVALSSTTHVSRHQTHVQEQVSPVQSSAVPHPLFSSHVPPWPMVREPIVRSINQASRPPFTIPIPWLPFQPYYYPSELTASVSCPRTYIHF